MTIEHYIVGAVGFGYATVGIIRFFKGDFDNTLIWCGYAIAQVGLWRLLK